MEEKVSINKKAMHDLLRLKSEFDDIIELLKTVMCHDLQRYYDFIITPLELSIEASKINGSWAEMKSCLEYIH